MIRRRRWTLPFMVTACVLCGSCGSSPELRSAQWPQALQMADFILADQQSSGAIPDTVGGLGVNQDSTMEYALIGLAAAYSATKNPKYLTGFESGIKWLADREEMTAPMWKGSWFLQYNVNPPFDELPTPQSSTVSDVRGVDATSALFAYLLYLDKKITRSDALAKQYEVNARAALDFVINRNLDVDGFSWSSWQLFTSDNQWHLFQFKYSADQGDVYLGMHAGELLYNDSKYANVATNLRTNVPQAFFSITDGRYALALDNNNALDTSTNGFIEGFAQGYLSWMWGPIPENQAAMAWLRIKVLPDGSAVTMDGAPAYSLTEAMLGLGDLGVHHAQPVASFNWLVANTFDKSTGGVADTAVASDTTEFTNVTSFTEISLLGFPAF
jgi:hypothetical protein